MGLCIHRHEDGGVQSKHLKNQNPRRKGGVCVVGVGVHTRGHVYTQVQMGMYKRVCKWGISVCMRGCWCVHMAVNVGVLLVGGWLGTEGILHPVI